MHPALVALLVVAGAWVLVLSALFVFGRRLPVREIAVVVPSFVRLLRGMLRDPRVARRSKLLLALGLLWIASPVDLVPEFIPVLGPLDDAVVALLLIRHLVRAAGPEVIRAHWRGDEKVMSWLLRMAGREAE